MFLGVLGLLRRSGAIILGILGLWGRSGGLQERSGSGLEVIGTKTRLFCNGVLKNIAYFAVFSESRHCKISVFLKRDSAKIVFFCTRALQNKCFLKADTTKQGFISGLPLPDKVKTASCPFENRVAGAPELLY